MKQWIEKHTVWIGIGLIIISLIGGTLLMVKKGAWASGDSQNSASSEKDKEISDLKNKITDLEKQITDLKSVASAPVSEAATSPSSNSNSASSSQPAGKININTATAAQLDSLPGIGPVYAGRIVEYRNQHGGFKSLTEIQNVKGIGAKTYAKFKDLITI